MPQLDDKAKILQIAEGLADEVGQRVELQHALEADRVQLQNALHDSYSDLKKKDQIIKDLKNTFSVDQQADIRAVKLADALRTKYENRQSGLNKEIQSLERSIRNLRDHIAELKDQVRTRDLNIQENAIERKRLLSNIKSLKEKAANQPDSNSPNDELLRVYELYREKVRTEGVLSARIKILEDKFREKAPENEGVAAVAFKREKDALEKLRAEREENNRIRAETGRLLTEFAQDKARSDEKYREFESNMSQSEQEVRLLLEKLQTEVKVQETEFSERLVRLRKENEALNLQLQTCQQSLSAQKTIHSNQIQQNSDERNSLILKHSKEQQLQAEDLEKCAVEIQKLRQELNSRSSTWQTVEARNKQLMEGYTGALVKLREEALSKNKELENMRSKYERKRETDERNIFLQKEIDQLRYERDSLKTKAEEHKIQDRNAIEAETLRANRLENQVSENSRMFTAVVRELDEKKKEIEALKEKEHTLRHDEGEYVRKLRERDEKYSQLKRVSRNKDDELRKAQDELRTLRGKYEIQTMKYADLIQRHKLFQKNLFASPKATIVCNPTKYRKTKKSDFSENGKLTSFAPINLDSQTRQMEELQNEMENTNAEVRKASS